MQQLSVYFSGQSLIKRSKYDIISCLFQVTVCNGKQDCSDGSDETCNMEKVNEEVADSTNIYNDQQRAAGSRNDLATFLSLAILLLRIYS